MNWPGGILSQLTIKFNKEETTESTCSMRLQIARQLYNDVN